MHCLSIICEIAMASQFIRVLYALQLQLVFASVVDSEEIPNEKLYVYNGDSVNLVCPFFSMVHPTQWRGPVGLTVYTYGGRIKQSLLNYERLKLVDRSVDGESSLLISNFSVTDEGLYRCITKLNGTAVNKDFTVTLYKPPSNIAVSNATEDRTVLVLEGEQITLSCNVDSGNPDEMMTWISNDILLNSGGPGYLEYIFVPTRIDHLRYFTCSASNSNKYEPISHRVQLNVEFIPRVTINGNETLQISEGQKLVLTCVVDTNVKNFTLKWILKDIVDVTEKNKSYNIVNNLFDEYLPKSTLTILRISRDYNGPIQCQATNNAGVGTDTVHINVKYKPILISNISLMPLKTEIDEPANVSFIVQSFQTPNIVWMFSSGGTLGLWSIHRLLNESDNSDTYIMSSIIVPRTHTHFGNYTVRVRNDEGSDDMMFELEYKEWHVNFIPKKMIVNTSCIVQMCCMVNPKHYTGWAIKIYHYWNGVFIRQFDDVQVDQNSANLSFYYVDYTDTGEYICSMSIKETVFTSAILLQVLGSPVITRKRIIQSQKSMELHVDLYSIPPHSLIEWFSKKNGREMITNIDHLQAKQLTVNTTVFISSYKVNVPVRGLNIILWIANKNKIHTDKYICHIKNDFGAAETSFDMLMYPGTFTFTATANPDNMHSNSTNVSSYVSVRQSSFLISLISVFAITNAMLITYIVVRRLHKRTRVLREISGQALNQTRRSAEIELEIISLDHTYSYSYEEVQSISVGAVSIYGSSEYSETSTRSCDRDIIQQQNSNYEDLCYSHRRHSFFENASTKNFVYSSLFMFPRCVKSEGTLNSQCDLKDPEGLKKKNAKRTKSC